MNNKSILIEIGTEEIPASFITNAEYSMFSFFEKKLAENNLRYNKINSFSTPRRISVIIYDLQEKQDDEILEKIGPSIEIAFKDKLLTRAGEGFLRSANAVQEDIYIKETAKGEKIAVKEKIFGKFTTDIIKDSLEEFLFKISFPKSMRWNNKNYYFPRPIRWIILLVQNEVIPFKFNPISTGNYTFGNRFIGLDKKIIINNIEDYEKNLKKAFVIPNRTERKQIIKEQIDNLFINTNYKIIQNDRLLEIVTDLVEFPTAVLADFEEKFLYLPEKIIISTISENQKYFAVQDEQGRLVNKFVFISNGDPVYSQFIKIGNEKVIKARLNDAEFFFREDTKIPLSEYVPKLEEVLFEASLGNLLEKTVRIEKLTEFLINKINKNETIIDDKTKFQCLRTAKLAKADLVTLMLNEKEFTKLQGYVGMKYAQKSGEDPEVAQAINEHYLPRGQNDELPQTIAGSIVAIADKIDTICGIIGIDSFPTGSNDPFALRRAANGIMQIIQNKNFDIEIYELIEKSFELLEEKLPQKENNIHFVKNYFKQRIAWSISKQGIEQDIIQSVMHIDFNNVLDVSQRAKALQIFKKRDDFVKLVTGYKRVSNIIADIKEFSNPKPDIFREKEEKDLFRELQSLSNKVEIFLKNKKYVMILEELVTLSQFIDNFFDNVLVNTDDEILKNNRYNLLNKIRKIFIRVADLNLITINKNT